VGELDVRHHAQQVLAVALVEIPTGLVVAGQQDLRPQAEPQPALRERHALGDQGLGLPRQGLVQERYVGRVKGDVVLDQEQRPHAADTGVVLDVGLVLDQLQDGREEPHVAAPQEDVVHPLRHPPRRLGQRRQLAHVVAQQDHRQPRPVLLHRAPEGAGRHVGHVGHAQHQVEGSLGQRRERRAAGGHPRHARRRGQAQAVVLADQELRQVLALRQAVRVVQAGHQQHLAHAHRLQVVQRRAGRGVAVEQGAKGGPGHGRVNRGGAAGAEEN
jgi:hypothetical protein